MKSNDKYRVYQIKITLAHSEPSIWRRFLIEPHETLYYLHHSIQIIMGWTNSHIHQYRQNKNFYAFFPAPVQ